MCALTGCEVAIEQPARGGRHRLYCSNAHRAEAGRRRLAEAPDPTPPDVLDSLLDQLGTVLGGLRRHHGELRSIDPVRQTVEVARIRAEATQQVLAAQQEAAAAAEVAVRTGEELAAERLTWQAQRADLETDVTAARAETARAGEVAASAKTALAEALSAHHAELGSRDGAAARAAAAHEAEMARLAEQLERARTAAAASSARAESADQRAARSDEAARREAERATAAEGEAARLRADLAAARAGIQAATVRAEAAEALAAQTRADLAKRDRHDLGLAELRGQLTQLLARQPRTRRSTKAVTATADTAGKVDRATNTG